MKMQRLKLIHGGKAWGAYWRKVEKAAGSRPERSGLKRVYRKPVSLQAQRTTGRLTGHPTFQSGPAWTSTRAGAPPRAF